MARRGLGAPLFMGSLLSKSCTHIFGQIEPFSFRVRLASNSLPALFFKMIRFSSPTAIIASGLFCHPGSRTLWGTYTNRETIKEVKNSSQT